MFYGCEGLSELNVSQFNTSNVCDMSEMFCGCEGLNELNVSQFNTSKVTNMSRMFFGCGNLKELKLSSFDTSKVTDMHDMLYCGSLEKIITPKTTANEVADLPKFKTWKDAAGNVYYKLPANATTSIELNIEK